MHYVIAQPIIIVKILLKHYTSEMKFKKISRQDLIERATAIINKPPTIVNNLFYELLEWRNIKNNYIKENPLCELCLNEGKEKKSADVHHITPISQGGEPFQKEN